MNKFSIADVEKITGVGSHTLRSWEKRHGVKLAGRSEGNTRYFSDEDLKRLLNISMLIGYGFKVGAIFQMSDAEVARLVHTLSDTARKDQDNYIQLLIAATLDFDELRIVQLLEELSSKFGLTEMLFEYIYPFLHRIGVLWTTGNSMPAQEHFVSNLIVRKILVEIDKTEIGSGPLLLLALLEDEEHEIGLLLSYYLARKAGFRCVYLGRKVPADDIEQVVNTISPRYLLTFFTLRPPVKVIQMLNLASSKGLEVLTAGKTAEQGTLHSRHFSSPAEFYGFLKEVIS